MRGGKPLPKQGDPEPNNPNYFWWCIMKLLEPNFCHLFLKKIPKYAWHEWNTGTECQLARSLWWIFPIGARDELATRANAKTWILRVFQRNYSSGEFLSLCRRMTLSYFHHILLLTGHMNSPPMYRMRDCRDSDKMMCSRMLQEEEGLFNSILAIAWRKETFGSGGL